MTVKKLKHEFVKEMLLGEIMSLPPGARFCTVKEIMNRYNVSQATVDKALQYLKKNGYVDATVGRGIYIKAKEVVSQATFDTVDLLFFGVEEAVSTPNFHSELVDHLSRQLGEKSASLRTIVLPHEVTMEEVVRKIDELNSQAVLLCNLYNADIYQAFRRRKIPFVLLFPNLPNDLTNSVLIDNRLVCRNWIRHLAELGHRRIAFLHGADERYFLRDQHQRIRFFYEEMCLNGVMPDPELVLYAGFTPREGYDATRRLFEQDKSFSAVITSDVCVPGVYDALYEHGLEPGRDISVMGTDDCLGAQYMKPPLTTVRIPRGRVSDLAIRLLEKYWDQDEMLFPNVQIESDLMVRKSTCPVYN